MAEIKFQKHAIVYKGKRIRVRYSKSTLINYPEGTITIYAKEYGNQLPEELHPENDTDYQTDYFDKDRARITPDSQYYTEVRKFVKD
jgi:hypothetical protein